MSRFVTYTADDEEPKCVQCDHFFDDYDCTKWCGSEHGWFGYRRTEEEEIEDE